MLLASGTRLDVYEIVSLIGAGGMGEVYRARDTRLHRDVAIKVLPEAFAADPDRLARFTREAQTLASLNHPNIAHIHGLEESGSVRALVMELVEGEDLAAIIARGPLPIAESLTIARQIVDALEAAHEQGVIHRDLKPANIKVRPDGTVKILDFGLAKALATDGSGAGVMNSPTLTMRATQMGVILGTAAYMAPEQAKGKVVDKRADIWAFGVVLYEMLTGRGPFIGETIPETLAQVMTREVDLTTLPDRTPPQVHRLIARCLEKEPKQRLRDIGDARLILEDKDAGETGAGARRARMPPHPAIPWLRGTAIALLSIGAGAFLMSRATRRETVIPSVHLSIALPAGEQVTTIPAVSPDGRTIAYSAGRTLETSRLYLRALDSFTSRAVHASEGAQYPFFSPDGQSVGFFAGGKMWRAPVAGGASQALAASSRSWGGSWCGDGTIVYAPTLGGGLWRVGENGGTPLQLTKTDAGKAGYAHVYPQCLPGTDDILFAFFSAKTFYAAALSPSSGSWRQVTPARRNSGGAVITVYAASGHLLAGDGATGVTGVAWTPATTAPKGLDTVVIPNVYWIAGNERAWFNVSASGTVVYAPGNPLRRRLVWVDRNGAVTPVPGEPDSINEAAVSRDGKRIVRHGNASQWVEDLAAGTRTRIVSDLLTYSAGWLPGSDRIVVSSNIEGDWDLYTVSASGGTMTSLLKKPLTQHPVSVAPDGSVIYAEAHPDSGSDLWILPPGGQPRPLVVTPFNERSAAASWDGKSVAYASDDSGRLRAHAPTQPAISSRRVSITLRSMVVAS